MSTAARTPEELDELLEDAFVLRDNAAFDALFDAGAVLADKNGMEARGRAAISRGLVALSQRDWTYIARTRHVLRTGRTALVVADGAIHVLRRGRDGAWRAAISLPPSRRRTAASCWRVERLRLSCRESPARPRTFVHGPSPQGTHTRRSRLRMHTER
jgi:ketosteroid isomerase-like protein